MDSTTTDASQNAPDNEKTGHTHCLNCGTSLSGPYCSRCGQHDRDLRRPFWTFTIEFADNIFSLDSRLAHTLIPLFSRPGRMSRLYVEGHRANYVAPVRLMLISVLVFFLAVELGNVALLQLVRAADPAPLTDQEAIAPSGPETEPATEAEAEAEAGIPAMTLEFFEPIQKNASPALSFDDSIETIKREIAENNETDIDSAPLLDFISRLLTGMGQFAKNPELINGVFNTWMPRAMLVLVPVFALLLRAMYWRKDAYFFNQLVFSLHFHAFLFLLLTGLVILGSMGMGAASGRIYFFGVPAYLLLSMKHFYGQGWWRTIFKFLTLSALYNIVLIAVLLAILLIGLTQS
ncbi:hypothetical protein GCM10007972_14050 [Iodidimonas muriae]|uniref:DUF3667 domain-containing protein n=1 Tax=Iodidimonas muriae TaxID=261467 RepID=A0ABQ2LCK2_9PROT|nr:DUF3667 domain-containing protein [Iodidimonas muriae]GER07356.1 hypothetical protein JCM17843_16660 [Kordiimonadales bacterium JCM 17843]GGO10840.1 hypothetical protein GCM10007972_14050 [Iodidimonas muriae]